MTRHTLNRLRSMTRDELAFRARVAARTQLQRASARVRAPRWDRASLTEVLAPDVLDGHIAAAIKERRWVGAHERLLERVCGRPATFVLNPGSAAALRRAILARWPEAAFEAAARAERVIAGDYDLLGYRGLRFDCAGETGSIDWHLDPVHGRRPPRRFWADVPYLDPRHGDHKVVWELNRHQHWMALSRARWLTGDERYAGVIRRQLSDWLEANPPLIGVNWASMLELGFRSLSWLWTMHALLVHEDGAGEPWLIDLLIGLDRQLLHVEENLSHYFSPNTHLTGEALALFVAGHALPELARSARRIEIGRKVLIAEIQRQVSPDGGHAERATHYHRYTLDFYLLALLTAEQSEDEEAATVFRDAVRRMARYLRAMAGSEGTTPRIGDDDGGSLWPITGRSPSDVRDTLSVAAIVLDEPDLAPWGPTEEAFWLTWSTHAKAVLCAALPDGGRQPAFLRESQRQLQTSVFPDTGYVVMSDRAGTDLVFDAGAHGYLNGGHAHADALAVTLAVNGHPLLIDPGTATYTMDPVLRNRMRSSSSHNTLTLDGVSPSVPSGPFHWRRTADARLDAWRGNVGFAWAEGAHDGYPGARHRRSIVQSVGGGTLIVDQVGGRAPHAAQLHWHFDPAWRVACESARVMCARHDDGTLAWVARHGGSLWLVNGDHESSLGWYSPRYGILAPTWSARVTWNGVAPLTLATWVGTASAAPSLEQVRHDANPACETIEVRVSHDGIVRTTLLCPGEPPVHTERTCTVADYHTDARLLHYATRDRALLSLAAADTTHVLALGDDLLSVAADDHVSDVYIEIAGEALGVWASRPLPRLRLQGAALAGIAVARLNGRELPVTGRERGDVLVIDTSAWGEPGTIDAPATSHARSEYQQSNKPFAAARAIVCAE
jgi:uncharacterized heparinase superfamily protein